MVKINKPKRAIIAYCVLAQRLQNKNISRMQALTPFLAEASQDFVGELFNSELFSKAVEDRFGLKIPRLAVLGLAEQMAADGLLKNVSEDVQKPIYQFSEVILDESYLPLTEPQVEAILGDFVEYARKDLVIGDLTDDQLHEAFVSRLLNIDSLKILTRKETGTSVKRTSNTLILNKGSESQSADEKLSYHLDYLVSQFLIDLRGSDPRRFEQISDVAFASMAAEALACFSDPIEDSTDLSTLTVYLDTPLLLDMLGVNSEYSEYGTELLEAIRASGAMPAVFEHCIVEAEVAIQAQLTYLRSGINQQSERYHYSAKPDLLNALVNNVADRVYKRLKIQVQRDPEIQLHKRNPKIIGDIESEMQARMARWGNDEAISHDKKSILTLITISDSIKPPSRVCDSKWIFLTRNTTLVAIANDVWKIWLKGTNNGLPFSFIERVSPISMSDKQFSGYLWARSGHGNGKVTRARLLAYCSSAIRPRADIKAKAYNMAIDLFGKPEAEDIAALLEDTEGVKALMRVTRGDPEDITPERLPLIIERVKTAAGEFAAGKVREEKELEITKQKEDFDTAIKETTTEFSTQLNLKDKLLMDKELAISALEIQNETLINSVRSSQEEIEARSTQIERVAHNKAHRWYSVSRWTICIFLVVLLTYLADVPILKNPDNSFYLKLISLIITFSLAWFVPEVVLGSVFIKIAQYRFRTVVELAEPKLIGREKNRDYSKKWID
ncbi:hypothetical protein [Methylophilus medardicus]|uniref:Uncharacterized protein n=1 Tax=Methylophilus medardicus TaxID=2588534 RepID=A0A5B8CPT8_9PROT|nr:hypothetical protein [Methylophilus medardicus]QDC43209.1 hypothetical protein FIU01_00835 [Methylophilus medardicus]QDC48216.1 hypothetical protein FIU00_00835 [Methylophilus medardicus]QDC51921.1 hypothetical protein FIT99_00835 [Methylophilus medardicus]